MKTAMLKFLSIFTCIALAMTCVQAEVIIESVGGQDPETVGFTFSPLGTTNTGSGFDTEDHWYVNSTRRASYQIYLDPNDFQHPDGWTSTWRVKVLPDNWLNHTDSFFNTRDASTRWDWAIVPGSETVEAGVYILKSTTSWTRVDDLLSFPVDVSQYHTYQMIYDPVSDTASFYIDGCLATTLTRSEMYTPSDTIQNELRWGDQQKDTVPDLFEQRYALVRFETGQFPLTCNPPRWAIDGFITLSEEQLSDSYTFEIIGTPSDTVTVTVTAEAPLLVNGASQTDLVFDPVGDPELSPQVVTVTVVNDDIPPGDNVFVISHTSASNDSNYNNLDIRDVEAQVSGPWCGQPGTFYYRSDLNQDCYVDIKDLTELAEQWLLTY